MVLERRTGYQDYKVETKIRRRYQVVSLSVAGVSPGLVLTCSFEYINPPPHRTIASIRDTPVFGSEYLHVSPPSTPEDLIQILQDLKVVKNSQGESWSPKILFEPHPLSCKPENKEALERVASQIDVLSSVRVSRSPLAS